MMNKNIKKFVEKEKKKIGKEAMKKINLILIQNLQEIIRKATKNADFSGRKTIKPEDIENLL